jgi:two-component system cell cycle response regulator
VSKRERPDLILLDSMMPNKSGLQLLTELRADPELRSIPVIMLSSASDRENVLRCARLGVSGIVAKPIDAADLQSKIRRALHLDTSHRYFQYREDIFMLSLPEPLDEAVAAYISPRLCRKLIEAVDGGLNRLIVDMSRLARADVTLLKLLIEISYLTEDLGMRYCLVCSAELGRQCRGFQETADRDITTSLEEAADVLNRPRSDCAASQMS